MKTDFTGMSPKEVAEAVTDNINERRLNALTKFMTDGRDIPLDQQPTRRDEIDAFDASVAALARTEQKRRQYPVIGLAEAGATPEEISALLIAHNEPQLAKVITTTGILDNMDSTARAVWLASMLPQQPTAEITLGR